MNGVEHPPSRPASTRNTPALRERPFNSSFACVEDGSQTARADVVFLVELLGYLGHFVDRVVVEEEIDSLGFEEGYGLREQVVLRASEDVEEVVLGKAFH